MTSASASEFAINVMYGLPRMADAEPEIPFTTCDTPRPNANAAADTADTDTKPMMTFAQAAKESASTMKNRRSPKSRTVYRISTNSRHIVEAFNLLETRIADPTKNELMTRADFELLKNAIGRYLVRLHVSDQMTTSELRTQLIGTRFAEIETERSAAHIAASTTLTMTASEAEAAAIKYNETRDKYEDLKYLREILEKEEQRVMPVGRGGYYGNVSTQSVQSIPNVPTQHAQIAATSGTVLRNILKPETIRRKFISLKILTENIRKEVACFLKDEDRRKDRAEVVKQIKESFIVTAAAAAAKRIKNKQ